MSMTHPCSACSHKGVVMNGIRVSKTCEDSHKCKEYQKWIKE